MMVCLHGNILNYNLYGSHNQVDIDEFESILCFLTKYVPLAKSIDLNFIHCPHTVVE